MVEFEVGEQREAREGINCEKPPLKEEEWICDSCEFVNTIDYNDMYTHRCKSKSLKPPNLSFRMQR